MTDTAAPETLRLFRAFRDALATNEPATELRTIHEQLLRGIEQLREPSDDLIQAYNVVLTGHPSVAELSELIARLDPPAAVVHWDSRDHGPVQVDLRRAFVTLGIRVYDVAHSPSSDSTDWILSTRELTPGQVERAAAASRAKAPGS